MIDRHLLITKEHLSETEKKFLGARNVLRMEREEYWTKVHAGVKKRQDEEAKMTPDEWIDQATAAQLKEKLDERGEEYDAKARVAELRDLLRASLDLEQAGHEENEEDE